MTDNSFVTKKTPTFPLDALPRVIRDYAIAVANDTQTAPDMAAACGLGAMSAALTGKYFVCPKGKESGWKESSNLYNLIVADPSEKKSAVVKAMTSPLKKCVADWNEQHKDEITRWKSKYTVTKAKISAVIKEAAKVVTKTKSDEQQEDWDSRLEELERGLRDLEENPVRDRIYTITNATSEALEDKLVEQRGNINIISGEPGIFSVFAGIYNGGNVNIDAPIAGYDGESINSARVSTSGRNIENPYITILLMTQPIMLKDALNNKQFMGRGLMASADIRKCHGVKL
jgi:polyhydroxyalkanoate synthesis regulator phasin